MIRLGLLLLVLPILVLLGVYFWELGDVRACHLEGATGTTWKAPAARRPSRSSPGWSALPCW